MLNFKAGFFIIVNIKKPSELRIKIDKHITTSIENLLSNYEVGQPGELQYRINHIPDKISKLGTTYFVSLEKSGKEIGTACFCRRMVYINGLALPAYYIRYFTLHPAYRTLKKSAKINASKQGKIKTEIATLLNQPLDAEFHNSALYYAYVDLSNERSRNLCHHFGFEPIRNFQTFGFSRFSPKKDNRVSRVGEEKGVMLEFLKTMYASHNFTFFDYTFLDGDYFVLKENGEILAGVQAYTIHWQITHLPGLQGKLVLGLLPNLPYISLIFSPDFEFLAFDSIYVKEGYEELIPVLLESVCKEFNRHSGLFWLDTESFLIPKLSRKKLGLLDKFHNSKAQLVVKTVNISSSERAVLNHLPCYISAFDLS